ncbi:MAG: DUF503 domain-containing protein [Christensenellales bacterium]|jgi:uncharacterized protein YlxP (DUF503 family)
MLIVYINARLRAPWCRSLKDKRAVIRPLMHQLRKTFNVTTAEAGEQDIHSLLEIAIAALAFDAGQADSIAENIHTFIQGATQAEIISWEKEFR